MVLKLLIFAAYSLYCVLCIWFLQIGSCSKSACNTHV
uniref:Uncharacterized protein n=1 Tax=Anguilla anguilla TaxID=7936 RepID=A0A0E9VUZ1_ANGAN